MKTNHSSKIALAVLALAALVLAGNATAQYIPAGHHGIAASPKVRQMLNQPKASPAPSPAMLPLMACPKCSDVLTTQVNRQVKAGQVLAKSATQKVPWHTCTACETKLTLAGEDKARHTLATHKCAAGAPNPAACCATN
ncbi:MAG TPA: hypothetical protein VG167_18255 [Verrucomicrobiae bacterium]|nr:hypothetical protein [Verrucomicrobiae bacterium]